MKDQEGKVIPFRQNASFFNRRGAKEMGKNDLVSALFQYRKAFQDDPNNAEACFSMAEILSEMQRYEESNRLLLTQLSMGDKSPEILFGLACNFYGIHEFEYAAQCLEQYLEADPDGDYVYDAEDFLDFLEDDTAMGEVTGLYTDEDYDTDGAVIEARHLMDGMDMQGAIALLESHVEKYPRSTRAQNQLALAYYCAGERNKAIQLANAVLESSGNDAQALCNSALFLHSVGDDDRAKSVIDTVKQMPDADTPEILHNLAVLQLEFKLYNDAHQSLTELAKILPYDENVIHKLGYCRFMMGNAEGAMSCYRKLLRINPDDTVAKYYFGLAKRNDPVKNGSSPRWMIPYQVPFVEAFRRLNQINRMLGEPAEKQLEIWKNDVHYRALIVWALDLPENRAKNVMLSLIYSYGDARAERILRDFLLRTDQPDDAKRVALSLLKRMKTREPYMSYLNGDWVMSRVSMIEYPDKMPPAYEAVLDYLTSAMGGARSERAVAMGVGIFKTYLVLNLDHLPRLTQMQQNAMAAALEYLGCKAAEEPVPAGEVAKKYRVTERRLRNAIEKLMPGQENEPCD